MSYLSITQLENNDVITTGLRISRNMTIRAMRIAIYKHGSPNGTLTLSLKEDGDLVDSVTLAVSLINADVGTYFHGFVSFEFDSAGVFIRKDPTESYKEYDIEIELNSHTDDSDNYIGLIRSTPSNQFVDSFGSIFNEDAMNAAQLLHFQPYAIEIYAI